MSSVSPTQRWAPSRPCPICGGNPRDGRGASRRCFGFASDINPEWVECTREEHAGRLTRRPDSESYPHKVSGDCPCGVRHDSSQPPAPLRLVNAPKKRVASTLPSGEEVIYSYRDEQGVTIHQTVRRGYGSGKAIYQRRPDGSGGWINSLEGARRVLYNLPAIVAADHATPIYVVEGERDAETLIGWGFLATTNAMGAGKWDAAYTDALRGRHVVILKDNDKKGGEHAEAVAMALHAVAASVRMPELPGLPDKGDVTDWASLGGTRLLLDHLKAITPAWAPPALPGLRLRTIADILATPAPEMLIADILPAGGITVLYSAPGVGKSFLALDMALRIALGWSWFGRPITQGSVLYVAAEGAGGLGVRLRAWYQENAGAAMPECFRFITHAIYPTHADTGPSLLEALLAAGMPRPALIVLDTLARCNDGDENSTTDMSKLIQAIDGIKAATGAAVLLVHHRGHVEGRARGSSALLGAADAVIGLEKDKDTGIITMRSDKMKDAPDFDPWRLVLKTVQMDTHASCVIALASGAPIKLRENMRSVLSALAAAPPGGMGLGEVEAASNVPHMSTFRAIKEAEAHGLVISSGSTKTTTRKYVIQGVGREALSAGEYHMTTTTTGLSQSGSTNVGSEYQNSDGTGRKEYRSTTPFIRGGTSGTPTDHAPSPAGYENF